MKFEELSKANLLRCEKSFHPLNDWSPSDWSNAMAGECGEVCNLTKKLRRGEDIKPHEIGREIADSVIYADLLAQRLGLSLGDLVKKTFNNKSDEVGSDIYL
ncbi:MAG: hypothetical protein AMJ75_09350 [Phycisphaerae bacterium SM1_79]|nr:MAG: hypothetical protein AMJ75_09350 [Phycisphaerae bacterium SM1_79]